MRGSSLMSSLNHDGQGDGQGFAFTQYFDRHSITALVGLIDGQYHYVYYLDTQKTQLRPLNEAQIWSVDRPTAPSNPLDGGRGGPARSCAIEQFLPFSNSHTKVLPQGRCAYL